MRIPECSRRLLYIYIYVYTLVVLSSISLIHTFHTHILCSIPRSNDTLKDDDDCDKCAEGNDGNSRARSTAECI